MVSQKERVELEEVFTAICLEKATFFMLCKNLLKSVFFK